MDRREAIDILVGVIATNSEEENEALDLAIEALKESQTTHDQMDACYLAQKQALEKLQLSEETSTNEGDAESATTTHGRLVDADALAEDIRQKCLADNTPMNIAIGKALTVYLLEAPTIVPATHKSATTTEDCISRQAAIELACWRCKKCERQYCEYKDSCETMRLLDALPSEDPKPPMLNNDCISRKQAIEALDRIGSVDTEADREYARNIFDNLPPVTPKPVMTEAVREDCITRAFALEVISDYVNYPTEGDKTCAIKNAPSVTPTVTKSWVSKVRCERCKYWNGKYCFCPTEPYKGGDTE